MMAVSYVAMCGFYCRCGMTMRLWNKKKQFTSCSSLMLIYSINSSAIYWISFFILHDSLLRSTVRYLACFSCSSLDENDEI